MEQLFLFSHTHERASVLRPPAPDEPLTLNLWWFDFWSFSTLWSCESNTYSVDIVLHIWIFGVILSIVMSSAQWGHSSQSTLRSKSKQPIHLWPFCAHTAILFSHSEQYSIPTYTIEHFVIKETLYLPNLAQL